VRGAILIALVLAGALAGCQESGFDESRETQRPLKVQHALDPLTGTKVPGQAERPLALTADALGDSLALGVRPVGVVYVPPFLKNEARGIEEVDQDDFARIETADPDLILGSKELQGDDYEELSRIAPTVMTEGEDWKLNLRLHGEALGRTNDAEQLLIDWDNRVAKVKDGLGGRDIKIILGAKPPVREFSMEPGSVAGSVVADLGLKTRGQADEVFEVTCGQECVGGGVLAARAALRTIAQAL
jgi:ABC-type Fe3+-hydroxamate transport system substrate-binding protein